MRTVYLDLKNSKAAYSRSFEAWLAMLACCSVCGEHNTKGLGTDGSDGEYGGPSFCLACLKIIVERLKSDDF